MQAHNRNVKGFETCMAPINVPDFTIKVDAYCWQVHSGVIARESKFFEKICNDEKLEKMVVVLHDDCPWIVGRMLQFFYYDKWTRSHFEPAGNTTLFYIMECGRRLSAKFEDHRSADVQKSGLQISAMLYNLADKYDARRLRDAAEWCLTEGPIFSGPDFLMVLETIGYKALRQSSILQKALQIFTFESMSENASLLARFKTYLATDRAIVIDGVENLDDAHVLQALKSTKSLIFSSSWVKELTSHLELADGTKSGRTFKISMRDYLKGKEKNLGDAHEQSDHTVESLPSDEDEDDNQGGSAIEQQCIMIEEDDSEPPLPWNRPAGDKPGRKKRLL